MKLATLFHYITEDLTRYSYGDLKKSKVKLFLKGMCYLGFWALLNYRVGKYLRSKTKNKIVWGITGINKLIIEILTGISIPYNCEIGSGLLIGHFSGIMIAGNVVIGENCTLHQGVTIGLAGRNERLGVPVLGNDVFIGAGAVLLGKIQVGNSVAIGANTVVTYDIPDNAVVVGNKAQIINYNGSRGL